MRMSLYDVLGVKFGASTEEIKSKYRKEIVKYHPDKTGTDHNRYIELNRAYKILSDPDLRKKYDETGMTDDVDINSTEIATDILAGWFKQILDNSGEKIFRTDIIIQLMGTCDRNVDICKSITVPNAKKRLEFLKKIQSLLEYKSKYKESSFDILGNVLSEEIEVVGDRIRQANFYIGIYQQIKDILKNSYCFHVEPR